MRGAFIGLTASMGLTCMVLAGCISPPPVPDVGGGGGNQATIPLQVLSAKLVPGRCFDGAEAFGDVCHVLEVEVDNSARVNTLDLRLAWTAVDVAGKVHDHGDSDADAVAGGKVVTVRVSFTVPDGTADMQTLRYSSFAGRGEATVPAY